MAVLVVVLAGCGGLSDVREDGSGSADGGSGADVSGGSAGSAGSGAGSRGGSAASGAGGTNAAGSGSAAGMASGGTAGACTGEDCASGFVTLRNFDESGWLPELLIAGSIENESSYVVALEPPRDQSRFALHLDDPEDLGGASLTFHMHQPAIWSSDANGLGMPYVGVRFWAKRGESGPTSVIVAITGLAQERSDYVDDLEASRPWLVRRFALTTDWRRYFALFRDFAPEEEGEPVPAADDGGQVLHWLVPRGESLDLWLDDLEFACAPGVCP